jgi:hypothetical protein
MKTEETSSKAGPGVWAYSYEGEPGRCPECAGVKLPGFALTCGRGACQERALRKLTARRNRAILPGRLP